MDQIRQNMMKAADELRALANSTDDRTLRRRLLEQAYQLERASQESSQNETGPRYARAALAISNPARG